MQAYTYILFFRIIFATSLLPICTAPSQVTLTATLRTGQSACPREKVIFTCIANGSQTLFWSSDEYIGAGGRQLEFSIADSIGKRINSTVDPDTFATLTSITKADETTALHSELHILSSLGPTIISCLTVNVGSRKNITLNVLSDDPPGVPQDPAAAELPSAGEQCVLLIKWSPPNNIGSLNIERYILNTSRNNDILVTNETSTLATFLSDCEDFIELNISVAAVDRCGRMGTYTGNFTPSLLPTSPPSPQSLQSGISTAVVIAIVIPVIMLVITINMIIIVVTVVYILRKMKAKDDELRHLIDKRDTKDEGISLRPVTRNSSESSKNSSRLQADA